MDEPETSQVEVNELEIMHSDKDEESFLTSLDHSLSDSIERLYSAKRVGVCLQYFSGEQRLAEIDMIRDIELASKLREIVSVKRQLDDVPSQAELIQYERRFAELNVHIQGKLRLTRKYYATFNALMEIKELMLKETSLLNSISSQFQDAISSPAGRMKLIDSMEEILKGTQQKQEKVQSALLAEQKVCDDLREKYAAAISEQRRCSSLLKAFQEECTKNDVLRNRSSS